MSNISETKKNHLWRKVIWQTDPDEFPLGPFHHVEVYCCEESNGYAVWYVRRLARDDARGVRGIESGDYLLDFFPKTARDNAIERTVLIANNGAAVEQIIEALDQLAAQGKKV